MTASQVSLALIQQHTLFQDVPIEALRQILENGQVIRLSEGDTVFRQGDTASRFYVLLQGNLKIAQTTPSGEQVTVRHVNPGEIFGIARAMQRTTFPATSIVMRESLILSWPNNYWDTLLKLNPRFAQSTFETVGQRLQDAHSRIRELSTDEVEQRVAKALLRMVKDSGVNTTDGIEIGYPVTRQDIAELTGTTLHTVSRLLSNWKTKGLVISGRRRITITSIDGLQALINDPDQPNT